MGVLVPLYARLRRASVKLGLRQRIRFVGTIEQ